MIRPRVLRAGDLVALVAPSGWVRPENAAAAERVLTGWGLRVRIGARVFARGSYLSGSDEERLADFNDALRDPDVRGVLCLRGGYGSQRIADDLDYAAVRADPKMVLGFSDITALHVAFWCEAGLATVHGSTAATLAHRTARDTASVRRALMTTDPVIVTADRQEPTFGVRAPGRAEGPLLGGNLTMLAATAGTRHRLDLRGAILLIEALNEESYRIDRSLVQLERAGWLDGVAGVAVGQFTDCDDAGPDPSVEEVLLERLGGRNIPILGGLPIGHGDWQTAVGLGVPAVLDAGDGTLTVQPAGR